MNLLSVWFLNVKNLPLPFSEVQVFSVLLLVYQGDDVVSQVQLEASRLDIGFVFVQFRSPSRQSAAR